MPSMSKDISILNIIIGLLLALLICLNEIRCMLGIADLSMLMNLIYIIFIAFCIPRMIKSSVPGNEKKYIMGRSETLYFLASIFLLLLCIVTGVFEAQYVCTFKLIVIVVMGFCIIQLSKNEIKICLNVAIVVSIIYVIYVIINIQKVNSYIARGSNYLNVTLPIGLILSVLLVRAVFGLTTKDNKIVTVCYFLLCGIFMYSLMLFSARGSILIPVVVVMVAGLLIGRRNAKSFIIVMLSLTVIIYVGYMIFSKYAGSYLLLRMGNLFESNESEDRWQIWKNYLDLIKTEHLWIIGGGTNYSSTHFGMYPHNFYLQMIGEFGMVGLLFSSVTTIFVLKRMHIMYRTLKNNYAEPDHDSYLYYEILAALIYVFLTFMKSFSIYDSSLLFIFFSLGLSLYYNNIKEQSIIR